MIGKIIDILIDVITYGNRPMRIFFFGGVFFALFTMLMLGQLLGVNTKIGGDVDLPNIVLMIASLFIGFGVSYSIVHFADAIKRKRNQDARND